MSAHRRAGDVVSRQGVRVGREQGIHPLADIGVQEGLSDQGYHLVAVVAPRQRCARLSEVCRERKCKRSGGYQFHVVPLWLWAPPQLQFFADPNVTQITHGEDLIGATGRGADDGVRRPG